MPSPEPDAHGRLHRSVEIGVELIDTHEPQQLILMSDGEHIPASQVLGYEGKPQEPTPEDEKGRSLRDVGYYTAATLGLVAIGIVAYDKLKRNRG